MNTLEKVYWLVTGVIILSVMLRIALRWLWGKFLTSHPSANTKAIDYTRSKFNKTLRSKRLQYKDITEIEKVLGKYSKGKKYNNNCHKIYSILKHCKVSRKDVAQVQLILDTALSRK